MRRVALFPLLVLLGCDSPSPAFMNAPATRIEVAEFLFSVRVSGAEAEAIRLRPGPIPREGRVLSAAAIAIEDVSGCSIARDTKSRPALVGDQAIVRARLACRRAGCHSMKTRVSFSE